MKKYPRCEYCKAKMKPEFRGTYDPSEYKKDSKGCYVKIRKRSQYRLALRCKRGTCQTLTVFSGPSKTEVHRSVNRIRQEQRHARLSQTHG